MLQSGVTQYYGAKKTQGMGVRVLLFLLECALGVVTVVLIAALAHWIVWLLPVAALLYLLVVIPIALQCGFWQAVVVSFSAVVAHSSFALQQAHWNSVADPTNGITLVVFVLVALIISRLSARVAEHVREAESWGARMQDLYEFTRRTLQMDLHVEPGAKLVKLVHEIFPVEAVAIYDADLHQVYQVGNWAVDPREMVQNVFYFASSDDDVATGMSRRVLCLGTVPVGSLVVRGETTPLTNDAIASLIAITFDRYIAIANENRIEMERQTEQLRATVLDSLAHAYKTPLTAIRAASTGLGEMGKLSVGQVELVSLIDEQTSLLNELTSRLLTTARLDAKDVAVHASAVDVAELMDEVVSGFRDRMSDKQIAVEAEGGNISANCDRQMIGTLLTQYVDNACKYSYVRSSVRVRAMRKDGEVIFSVHSFGPVIPVEDRERIFERYYRSSASAGQIAGTGIGLAVAKRVVQMHDGHVWVTSSEKDGTTFYAAIPAAMGRRS